MDININDIVKVRLNDAGRKILKNEPYVLARIEDKDGWSEWQLWELMRIFGPHLSLGAAPPFEKNVLRIAERAEA